MEKKLRSLITQLVNEEISLMEKKRKKDEAPSDENVELDLNMPAEEPATEPTTEPTAEPTTEPDMDLSGGDSIEKRIGQGLQMALDAAKEMPDGENKTKLVRQIGNTALFFLKTQIPGTGDQV
jgi:predicted component of type VI protein secretion system